MGVKLLVGLGNPGKDYAATYHNIGFMAIDHLAQTLGIQTAPQRKFEAELWQESIAKQSFILFKPQTFMNLSGRAIIKVVNFFKVQLSDLLVVHDDVDLPFGKLRYRKKGGHGGHNGMRDIIAGLGTSEFHRLKIGIGRGEFLATSQYVLMKINQSHQKELAILLKNVADLLKDFILDKQIQVTENIH